jgi:hypothetical protein
MALIEFFSSLTAELARLERRYEVRRFDHPTIAPSSSTASLLEEARAKKVGGTWILSPEGVAIRCALVDLYQKTHDRLWTALVIRAFWAMLSGLAKRLVGGSDDEQESLLLACFHDAIRRVDPHKDPLRLSMYVAQATKRPLFRALKKEIAWDQTGFGTDAELVAHPASLSHPLMSSAWAGPRGMVDAPRETLLETVGQRGALWVLVRQHYSGLSEKEQARVYRRLQQRRRRHVEGLRRRMRAREEAKDLGNLPVTRDHHGAVTCDHPGAVTCDHPGDGTGAVTCDTLEHGPCDRYARALSESSERDVTGDAIATHTTPGEVRS